MRDASEDPNGHEDNVRKVQTNGIVPEEMSKAAKQRGTSMIITLLDGIGNAAARGETLSIPSQPIWQ